MKHFLWLIALLVAIQTKAQSDLKPVTSTVAFTNVNIIPEPGRVISNGTVVIKDGLITAVGKNVTVPPGAREIKSDTMYLYAGFILGMSHAGVKMPEDKNQEKVKEPANPPDERAGITPERKVLDYLNAGDNSITQLRNLGFTIAQTAPEGGMLSGSAALIVLKGENADDLILKPQSALYATLDGASGVYPATILGVMAKFRELYRQSELAQQAQQLYAQQPSGLPRPNYDRTIEALLPVVEKKIPFAFKGTEVLDVHRILSLQEEFDFNLLLTEVKQGWDVVDKVKRDNIDVLFSLDLPEWKEEKEDSVKKESDILNEQEYKRLTNRKKEFAEKHFGQMAVYQDAGVPFAFSVIDAEEKDIHENLLKMIKHGLSEDAALAALTTTPASILGINQIAGTVEQGKLANLVISNKPYFEKDAKVRFVIIEGEVFEMEAGDTAKADPAARAAIVGRWEYSSESPQGEVTGIMTFTEEDGLLTGNITNSINNQEVSLEEVTLAGNKLTFSFTLEISGDPVKIDAVLTIEEDTFTGTYSAGDEAYQMKGEKVP